MKHSESQLELFSHDPAMLGRSGYARKALDEYETPEWVTESLLDMLNFRDKVWEPACGAGKMVRVLRKYNYSVIASDIQEGRNFLEYEEIPHGVRSIVTNPPYKIQDEFIAHAFKLMQQVGGMVCVLLRNEWDCASRRREMTESPYFFGKLTLTKRIRWIEGTKISPRHNYSWFVWDFSEARRPTIIYIP